MTTSLTCNNGLHAMTPDNTIEGHGIRCLACFRDAHNQDRLQPVPPGHRVVGWHLSDETGTTVATYAKLTDFVAAYSRQIAQGRGDDIPAVYRYDGPCSTYRLKRITEPRNAA